MIHMMDANFFILFLTGLTTGGLTCLAIQGSLLASIINSKQDTLKVSAIFLASKVITHTVLGFLLGAIGSAIKLTPIQQGYFQIILGMYLIGIAGNLLNLHPFFRYFVLTPPKFILKYARKITKTNQANSQIVLAMILGTLTIFLPCATTQAVEVLALATESPITSALMLFAFTIGTTPTFLIFSGLLYASQNKNQNLFSKVLGAILFIMAIYTTNSGVALTGSVYTIQNFYSVATNKNLKSEKATLGTSNQVASISVTNYGYSPANITLKKDVPVKLTLITDQVESCARSFTIPSLNIEKLLPETGTATLEFTPTKTGLLAFSCSMGMYTGNFNVIN